MQANPDKFQAIAVDKKTYAKEPDSCIFSSFIVFAFEQKCQGQKIKLDNIKE
jgi:hypothetical protein